MNLVNNLRNYILEEKFNINYEDGKIKIVNYINIPVFESNEIHITYKYGIIKIFGKELYISKLFKDELLITGDINKIEFNKNDE